MVLDSKIPVSNCPEIAKNRLEFILDGFKPSKNMHPELGIWTVWAKQSRISIFLKIIIIKKKSKEHMKRYRKKAFP